MATSDNRSLVDASPAAASRRWSAGWLGVLGVLLLVLMAGVALVQWRQLSLLSRAMVLGGDDIVLGIYQAENEYLRLRHAWPADPQSAAGYLHDELQLRYDIFVSRIELLRETGTRRLMADDAALSEGLQRVDDFIARADRQLGPGAKAPDTAALTALRGEMLQLGQAMHGMALRAAHTLSLNATGRDAAVRRHNRVGIALTLFLSALTLAFAFIALRQLYRLEQRRLALEELAASLREARKGAEAASAAKSAFLANMSHEIRTPFQGLLGMLSLLRETGLTPKQGDYLRTATESADHLLVILNDILDMSQLESGRMTLSLGAVDLRSLLRDVESLMRPQATRKALAMHLDADPALPERVLIDSTRVKQVLFNLLSNAIKFCEHGAVTLDVRRDAGEHGLEIEFVVTDTGIGMDEPTMAGLFTRFSQADNSRSRRHGGTGLGLEISRNLARLMAGDITVSSRYGTGSAFCFRLPLRVAPWVSNPRGDAMPDAALPGVHAAPSLIVLVAEDHAVNRQYMAALLENQGHHAHFAADGHETVRAVMAQRFDVILMDLHMPVLDGLGATRAIRALSDPAAATVPIVALTADAFSETRDRCLVAGMNDFLTKPISAQALATSLRRLFGTPAGALPTPDERRAPRLELAVGPSAAAILDQTTINNALQAMPRERLAAMLSVFLDSAPATVARLRGAMRDAQPLDLRVHAHASHGAALNLGLGALAATAEALHEGASHLPAHEIARLVQRYEDQVGQTRVALRQIGLLAPDLQALSTPAATE